MRPTSCLLLLLLAAALSDAERDYRIELRDASIKFRSAEHFDDEFQLRAIKLNETVTVLDGKIVFSENVEYFLRIKVTGYQRSPDGQWVKKFEQKNGELCTYLRENEELVKHIFQDAKNSHCPLANGEEWLFTHAQIDASFFPEDVPEAEWKLDFVVTTGDPVWLAIQVYVDTVKLAP